MVICVTTTRPRCVASLPGHNGQLQLDPTFRDHWVNASSETSQQVIPYSILYPKFYHGYALQVIYVHLCEQGCYSFQGRPFSLRSKHPGQWHDAQRQTSVKIGVFSVKNHALFSFQFLIWEPNQRLRQEKHWLTEGIFIKRHARHTDIAVFPILCFVILSILR